MKQERTKMKQKIIDILWMITLIIIFVGLVTIGYFLIVDIQSKVPKQVQKNSHIEEKTFQGRKVFMITPKQLKEKQKYIFYFHGGSYVAETSMAHWGFLEELANDTGMKIILPDYPLTPKYTYQDVFEMVVPLYQEIIKQVDPNQVIMMGDSAGGGLALALEEKLGEEKIDIPSQLILISPWLDTRMNNPKISQIQPKDKDLSKEALEVAGLAYAGSLEEDNYLINPIDGPLQNLKNVTIFTGTRDILNPDVHVLIEKAQKENVCIQLKEYPEAEHVWIVKKKENPSELAEKAYQELLKIILDF